MAVPIMRSYTTTGAALNIFTPSTDDITGLTIQQLNQSNEIQILMLFVCTLNGAERTHKKLSRGTMWIDKRGEIVNGTSCHIF